mmetsp:Transcript_9505/g.38794  ORF Transcript_9505/g.38794 Transcript_9505/m.38794 type:complete len:203 (+) Transcript_9505:873-1481(+)
MVGLTKNARITHLDLSHNKITNHGSRLLARLIDKDSVISFICLADNLIHAEVWAVGFLIMISGRQGGRYLGRALKMNQSLQFLNLRLNRLTDSGGQSLLEGLHQQSTLTNLNIAANSLGSAFARSFAVVLQERQVKLRFVDVSSNDLNNEDVESITNAIKDNSTLCDLELRMNQHNPQSEAHQFIKRVTYQNELKTQLRAIC